MPEISDDEFKTLTTAKNLLDLLQRSPKTRRQVHSAIKTHYPDTVVPEDYEEPLRNEVKTIGEKLDKFLDAQTTREEDQKLEAAFHQLRTDGGYTDDGIDKIKKIMVERKVADPLAAAAYYDKINPPPEPQKPTFGGMSWGIGATTEDADTKLLFDDEDAWMEREVGKVFREAK
jgi:hypothetical protein